MGQVWCAEDTRLERKVALKILPRDFAGDPERHARFEDEARILASLNHPNIATLHSLEHLHIPGGQDSTPGAGAPESADPLHVLVMELIEGTDLDKLIPEDCPLTKRLRLPFKSARACRQLTLGELSTGTSSRQTSKFVPTEG